MQLINRFMTNAITHLSALREKEREEGQTLVEYALIIALVSVVLVGALSTLQGGISGTFADISSSLGGAGS